MKYEESDRDNSFMIYAGLALIVVFILVVLILVPKATKTYNCTTSSFGTTTCTGN